MKKDIILAGVGGQGIITISVVIVDTAIRQGLNFRQSEVHGMSQRGGAVEAHVRINDGPIYGDLIAKGRADLLIAVEPMEALRHINYLSPNGVVVTNINCVKNIPDYPDEKHIMQLLSKLSVKVLAIDATETAKKAGSQRAQNIVMAGAAANYLGLDKEQMRASIKNMFERKGQNIVDINLKALDMAATEVKELEKLI